MSSDPEDPGLTLATDAIRATIRQPFEHTRSDVVKVYEWQGSIEKQACPVYEACECHVGTKSTKVDRKPTRLFFCVCTSPTMVAVRKRIQRFGGVSDGESLRKEKELV